MIDDAALARPAGCRRAAGRRTPPPLYDPVGWALVRAPLLPVDAYRALGGAGDRLARDPLVRTALSVASHDLAAQLEQGTGDARAAARRRRALLRYLIRMSTRPTPYGLFAGVGLAELGEATDLRITDPTPRTRTRPDMEWLLALVARLEARPEVRRQLRVMVNPCARLHGDRLHLAERTPLDGSDDASPASIRATSAVRRVLAIARHPVPWQELAERLAQDSGAPAHRVDGLLDELWSLTVLLTELRPPLTHPDPAGHVSDVLRGAPAAAAERAILDEARQAMARWDVAPVTARPAAFAALHARARETVPGFDGAPAQVDAALTLAGGRLHAAVAREAAAAAQTLLRIGPAAAGPGALDAYRHAFIDRYGADREVPLLELLDPDHGLGPPAAHGAGARADRGRFATRDATLRALALGALRDRRLAVTLDEPTLERLSATAPEPGTAPTSLDIAVFVLAESAQAVDAGDFRLLIGPNLGGQEAGRNLGRFGDLLGAPGRRALEAAARADARAHGGGTGAELVYLPRRARSANVVIRPPVRRHEVVMGTTPGVPYGDAVPAAEILIGVRDGRFYARWPGAEGDLRTHSGHMLNAHAAPVACRFLEEVTQDGRMQLSAFDWGSAADLPVLPRVTYGRVVLAPAQWRIDPGVRERILASSDAASALLRWRDEWLVPRHVYLTVADNRLLLDLEDPEQARQLQDELRRRADGGAVVLQEPLPGPEHAWIPGPGGAHLSELVIPMSLRAPDRPRSGAAPAPATAARRRAPATTRDRLRPPGSDWLFLKLYGPASNQDELLAGPIRSLVALATGTAAADRWFFLRYADPEPHLRLRFAGTPERLLGELLPDVCAWGADLIADGSLGRVAIDTYEREVERYGGPPAMAIAEEVFAADSAMVLELMRRATAGEPSPDRTTLAVLSIDALLDGVGLDAPARLALYRDGVPDRRAGSEDYRARQTALRRLLGVPGALLEEPGGAAVARLLAARADALRQAAARLHELARTDALEAPLATICRSYVHLHVNRLIGSGAPSEGHLLALLLRAREGLARAPVAPAP